MGFTHRVRYAEVDAQGVVFNAHWLTPGDLRERLEQAGEDAGEHAATSTVAPS